MRRPFLCDNTCGSFVRRVSVNKPKQRLLFSRKKMGSYKSPVPAQIVGEKVCEGKRSAFVSILPWHRSA